MERASLRLLALAAAVSLSCGCNPASTAVTSYDTQDLTGNWQVGISDPPYPGPYPITSFTGAVAGSGQNITAVFRAASAGCVSPKQDITFTGMQRADGTLALTSTNLPNNIATISAMPGGIIPLTSQSASFLGSLVVTGTGPCTMANIALRGQEFAPLTGTYTAGPITSTSGSASTFTAALTQAAANSDGQFPESGTITVAGSNCTNVFSLAGLVAGSALTATLTPTSGPAATATITASQATNMLSLNMTVTGTGCNAGTFTGSLTRQ